MVRPIADSTTTGARVTRSAIRPATRVSASLVARELPPNFITIIDAFRLRHVGVDPAAPGRAAHDIGSGHGDHGTGVCSA